jgi:hypothetical protein
MTQLYLSLIEDTIDMIWRASIWSSWCGKGTDNDRHEAYSVPDAGPARDGRHDEHQAPTEIGLRINLKYNSNLNAHADSKQLNWDLEFSEAIRLPKNLV